MSFFFLLLLLLRIVVQIPQWPLLSFMATLRDSLLLKQMAALFQHRVGRQLIPWAPGVRSCTQIFPVFWYPRFVRIRYHSDPLLSQTLLFCVLEYLTMRENLLGAPLMAELGSSFSVAISWLLLPAGILFQWFSKPSTLQSSGFKVSAKLFTGMNDAGRKLSINKVITAVLI